MSRYFFQSSGILLIIPLLLSFNPISCGAMMKSEDDAAVDKRILNKQPFSVPELEINGGNAYTKSRSVLIVFLEALDDKAKIRFGHRNHTSELESLSASDDSCLFSDYLVNTDFERNQAGNYQFTYTLTLNIADGPLDICVQTSTQKDLESDIALYPLTYDTTAPVLSSDVSNEISFDSDASSIFTLSGRAHDISGIKSLHLSLENLGTGKCLNTAKSSFQAAACPNWIELSPATEWSLQLASSLFEAGENYAIALKSEDLAGNQSEDLDLSRFNWNLKSPLSSSFEIDLGALYTINQNVAIRLTGTDTNITDVRIAEGTECTSADWQPYTSGLSILFNLSAGDGEKSVCLQVRSAEDEVSVKTVNTIFLDMSPPSATLDAIAASIGPNTTAGGDTEFAGTATDTGSGLQKVYVSLKEDVSNMCLNEGTTAFDVACPKWLEVSGTSIWTFTVSDAAFSTSNDYTITVRAQDLAGQYTAIASYPSGSFEWDSLL